MPERKAPATATERSRIGIWGTPAHPHWSVTAVQGSTAEELDALVDLALDTFDLVGERLATRRRDERARREELRR